MIVMITKNGYEMWLTFNSDKEKIQVPVLPESITVSNGSNNSNIDIAGLGEVVIMQSRPAYKYKFKSYFPKVMSQAVSVSELTDPLVLVERIKKWKEADRPIKFVLTDVGISTYCTIEDFQYSEEGGDVGTIQYSLELKEYREISTRQVTIAEETETATVSTEETRVDNTTSPSTYTVVKGDCLYNIAKSLYGDSSQWHKLYEANKGVIGGNPNRIYPGQVLTVPQ